MVQLFDGRTSFWQWDLDQRLIVGDEVCGEVHFENESSDCALVCEAYELDGQRVVDVPNILLQEAGSLRVYTYSGSCTKRSARFMVLPRQKPADYIYTETECWTVEKAVEKALQEAKDSGEFNGEDGTSIFAVTDSKFAQIEEYRLFHTGDVYIITDGVRCGNIYYADTQESAQLQGNIRGKAGERANKIHCYTTEEYQRDLPGYLIPGDVYIITEGDLIGNIYVATADDYGRLKGNISGADGKTPVKGVDYHTEVDKQEMVEAVLAALPDGDEVAY